MPWFLQQLDLRKSRSFRAYGKVLYYCSVAVESRLHDHSEALHKLESVYCVFSDHVEKVADVCSPTGERRAAVSHPCFVALPGEELPVVKLVRD